MLTEQSALELARGIASGRFSSIEVVDAHIDRVEAVNPLVNAMVENRFEQAREEARQADALRASGQPLPPLHGVPCTIKEFIGVKGMLNTTGIVSRRSRRATADATGVARLKKAGAIILGTTNGPEGGLWMETVNKIYGRTSNPWDLKRTSGGSSGGEGALVGAGASPIGLGSDVGGSIRIPAAFCGAVGHKPSGGLLPNTGHSPAAPAGNGAFLCTGPLVRRVEDLWPLIRILAGPDGRDPFCREMVLGTPEDLNFDGLVVYPLETNGRQGVKKNMRVAIRDAAEALRDRGARIRTVEIERLKKSLDIWAAMLSDAAETHYPEILGTPEKPLKPFLELMKCGIGLSDHTAITMMIASLDQLVGRFSGHMARLLDEGRALRAELDELLGDDGVILHPPYGRPAPRHWDAIRTPLSPAHTAIFNVMESPVTCLPIAWTSKNLPIGVQIVGRSGMDHLTVAVAAALEKDFGGWKQPPIG